MGMTEKIFYAHTVVGGVVNCIEDIYGGGTHTVPAVTFWETHRAKMGARNDKGMMGDIFYEHTDGCMLL